MRNARSIFMPLALALIFIAGCATQGGGPYSVGPRPIHKNPVPDVKSSGLSVIVPIFDPGIPSDPDDYEKKGIWPELRRAEANRFAVNLKTALEDTGKFEGVRVAPTAIATGHLYVNGKIVKSNGEDLKLQITVIDISGTNRFSKTYSYRAKEYDLEDPRKINKDLYEPIFTEIAADISEVVDKISDRSVEIIQNIELVRYGALFSPDYFSEFITTNRKGTFELIAAPAVNDPMVKRVEVIRMKDQLFLDGAQADYLSFKQEMDNDYIAWQRQVFIESKAIRKTRVKGIAQKALGTLAVIGGALVMAVNRDSYNSPNPLLGGAVALAGVAAVSAGMDNSAQAKQHKESLNEIGRSLNIELAPRVMQLEDQEVALEGSLEEQYTTWRSFLKAFYDLEATPETTL